MTALTYPAEITDGEDHLGFGEVRVPRGALQSEAFTQLRAASCALAGAAALLGEGHVTFTVPRGSVPALGVTVRGTGGAPWAATDAVWLTVTAAGALRVTAAAGGRARYFSEAAPLPG